MRLLLLCVLSGCLDFVASKARPEPAGPTGDEAIMMMVAPTGPSGISGPTNTMTESAPEVSSADVTHVRQGQGVVTLTLTGQHLDTATSVTVGGVAGAITTKSATSLAFTFNVPHGATQGARDIVVTSPGGSDTLTDGLTVDFITVKTGATGAGTEPAPLGHITQALAIAASGDTVYVHNGTYGPTGESFATVTPNVPDNVSVVGESQAGVFVVGTAAANAQTAFLLAGRGRVSTLTVAHINNVVRADNGGLVRVDHVSTNDIGCYALLAQGNTEVDVDTLLASNGQSNCTSITLHNNAHGVIRNCDLTDQDYGIELTNTANAFVENCNIHGTHHTGIFLFDTSTLAVRNSNIHDNAFNGICSFSTGAIAVSGTTISGHDNGIVLDGETTHRVGDLAVYTGDIHDNDYGILAHRGTGGAASLTLQAGAALTNNRQAGVELLTAVNLHARGVIFDKNGHTGQACATDGASVRLVDDQSSADFGTSDSDVGANTWSVAYCTAACTAYTGTCYALVDKRTSAATARTDFHGNTIYVDTDASATQAVFSSGLFCTCSGTVTASVSSPAGTVNVANIQNAGAGCNCSSNLTKALVP